jgi:hypothetical protein
VHGLEEKSVYCPYCGEPNTLLLDCSVAEQSYVEDCQVCCQPMLVSVAWMADADDVAVSVQREND